MDQLNDENKTINKTVKDNKQVTRRGRIYSDTALLPKKSFGTKVAGRPPLKDLATNVCTTALDNVKQTVPSITESTYNNNKTKTLIISGYISKVTENKLKARNANSTSSYTLLDRSTIKKSPKCTYSKNKLTCIVKRNAKVGKEDCRLFDGFLTSLLKPTSTTIFQGIPKDLRKPARKISLSHKLHPRQRRNIDAYVLDIYTMEYLENIIYYQLTNDAKYILNKNSLKKYNDFRAAVIHALIKVIEYLDQPISILFTSVRLFDHILNCTNIPVHMFQIVSYVVMWIVIKFDNNSNFPSVNKLASLCSNAYTVSDILEIERRLLKFFDFNINVSDITVYTNFYIIKLAGANDLLSNSVQYILECYALNSNFSTVIPSMQAAGAVCLALDLLQSPSTLWHALTNSAGYYTHGELENVMQVMLEQIHKIQDPSYKYRFPYEKYAVKDKQEVSVVLLRKLIAT